MDSYRHYFDAADTRSAVLPGAVIEQSLRAPSLWGKSNVTVFIEGLATGLSSMGGDVWMPDVTPPVMSACNLSYSSNVLTITASLTDAGTNTGDGCPASLTVVKNGVSTLYLASTTSGVGTITVSKAIPASQTDIISATLNACDAAGNWLLGASLGTYPGF